ncbi:MAG: nucleoside triphosphate pyrophosphohydrolase [Chlamydiae bacterium]|nr:nucleoside triphosphate pyrophosphohydrolase [Chlamydiota bacterium]MBI3265423.1 nucleoside triphosphate pyrophosphohydrolase [Chlamydiota bacterium]
MQKNRKAKNWVLELEEIMSRLRAKGGCPWDREQTHETLKKYLIEEAYELMDAIDDQDTHAMADELGDVLLQVVFHSQMAKEKKKFDLQKVARLCCEKLIRRHPHVFGDVKIKDSSGVKKQWEEIKKKEKSGLLRSSLLDGIPRYLPALSQAEKIQKKAAKVGFDWREVDAVVAKVEEEFQEVKEELKRGNKKAIREEIGDLLFSVVNLCRFHEESPEEVLRDTVKKFYKRFGFIEQEAKKTGKKVEECSLEQLEKWWGKAKKKGSKV